MRKLKLMFLISSLGGLVFMSQAFNKAGVMDQLNEIKKGNLSDVSNQLEGVELPGLDQIKKQGSDLLGKDGFDSNQLYEIDGGEYVYLRGKYYPYNPENIYYIDGEKVFYSVGKRKKNVPQQVTYKTRVDTSKGVKRTGANEISLNPVKAYSPKNIGNMMKTLKQAQENIGQRNKALEDLAK